MLTPSSSPPCTRAHKHAYTASLCCPHAYGCGAIHWSTVNLSEATPLTETDSIFPGSHQLSIALQLWIEVYKPLPSMLECWLAWSNTCVLQATTVVVRSGAEVILSCSEDAVAVWSSTASGSDSFLPSVPWWSLCLVRGMWCTCPMCGWALHRHLLSALGPVMTFSINCCTLHKETSLMRSESCTNLWVETWI